MSVKIKSITVDDPAPPGFEWRWTPSSEVPNEAGWRLVDPEQARGCRGGAPGRKQCGRPSVAKLSRKRYGTTPGWWHYCEKHLYGRKIENGILMIKILRAVGLPESEEPS